MSVAPVTLVLDDIRELMDALVHINWPTPYYEDVVVRARGRNYARDEIDSIGPGAWSNATVRARIHDGGGAASELHILEQHHGYISIAAGDACEREFKEHTLRVLAGGRRQMPRARWLGVVGLSLAAVVAVGGLWLVNALDDLPSRVLGGSLTVAVIGWGWGRYRALRSSALGRGHLRVDTLHTRKELADHARDLKMRLVFGLGGIVVGSVISGLVLPLIRGQ